MNSIRKKITVCLMATILIALIAVGVASSALSYRSTDATVKQMMSETAVLAAQRIEQELTPKHLWRKNAPLSMNARPSTASSGAT